jgi:major membrane immunogen (membrane-anchored lipoprotein)
MKKLIIFALSVFALFTSCQQRPQVFGVYIDGTFEQFLKDLDKEPWKCPINIDTIQHLSESEILIKAYSTEVIDLNEDSVKVDSIYITIELEKEKIKQFSYTLDMSETNFKAIHHAYERIYGSCRYYDVTEYSHACYWMIGKDCLWLIYDISEQQTKYTYIIN